MLRENKAHQSFRKTNISYLLIRTRANISYPLIRTRKKCSFFGKFDVLCFLETPALRFALLSYYRRIQRFIIVIFHRQLLIFLTTLIQIARILKKYLNQRRLKHPIVCRQLIIPLHRCLRGLQCTPKKMFLPAAINNKISTRIYSSTF